ncbi:MULTISPECIES: mitochondrial fission ELM1 family protein [unclassified Pseudovibrio]|uniref:mitochondrial fission ELM1 family protein n=1 Tax=unclassified Pseudovibrio TaxID=2627060 RepID=UPI0007AE41AD|nr:MULTISPECIES: mitochondrial fission ELM1 family protein [unclassified Pseudovibrio]KZK97515.1 hypothetical protein PsW74_03649 [Pseudovibrio sp. W74]KZL04781.1 hypothetical protein PsAD14_05020 [Pseudovibrio sp. Ad14]
MSQNLWVLTDGKIGDVAQCIGIADALGLPYEIRLVAPRKLFTYAMPWGPIDPKDAPHKPESPLAPPYPAIAIASGRRAVPYLRALKRLSKGQTFTVFLKDPKINSKFADFVWAPEHDGISGKNIVTTLTSPHRFSAQKLQDARDNPLEAIAALSKPKAAVLIGGNSQHHTFTPDNINTLLAALKNLSQTYSLMITCSRRTPRELATQLHDLGRSEGHLFWNGEGENPIIQYLANAEITVVTTDSTNMVGEATATGKPIYGFRPTGAHKKFDRFLSRMEDLGVLHPFPGDILAPTYEPIDATPDIADAISKAIEQKQTSG